jgi:hypothetical protein
MLAREPGRAWHTPARSDALERAAFTRDARPRRHPARLVWEIDAPVHWIGYAAKHVR